MRSLRQEMLSLVDKAVSEVAATRSAEDESIHRVRRLCKRVRAESRLLAAEKPARSRRAASHIRRAARVLSPYRDAQVLPAAISRAETLLLEQTCSDQCAAVIESIRCDTAQIDAPIRELPTALAEANEHLALARQAIESARIGPDRMVTARVLLPIYRKARQSITELLRGGSAETFHDLRKFVKAHLYQCRFLKSVYQADLAAQIKLAKRVGDLLGDAQDLAVLRQHCKKVRSDPSVLTHFVECCDQLEADFHDEACSLACRLFYLRPAAFASRLESHR